MPLIIILIIIALIVGGPLATIWALNTLFALGIAYNFWTWLAVIVLGVLVNGSAAKG